MPKDIDTGHMGGWMGGWMGDWMGTQDVTVVGTPQYFYATFTRIGVYLGASMNIKNSTITNIIAKNNNLTITRVME